MIAASVWHLPRVADADKERIALRQANAAAALARLGEAERVWPLLVHSPDPRLRSWLIHRLGPLGVAPNLLIDRLFASKVAGTLRVPSAASPTTADAAPRPHESTTDRILFDPETSLRRALLLALGEFDEASLPPSERASLLPRLMELYRSDPDAGVHAAAAWLARRWNGDKQLAEIDAARRGEKPPAAGRRWFVNSQGQTMVVIQGPIEFLMGSPASEKGHEAAEVQHKRRINRTFAIGMKPVTLGEYRGLTQDPYEIGEQYTRYSDLPVVGINWYMAAKYCNVLSKQEGLTDDQWCYEVQGDEVSLKSNYLSHTGYRLPSEAEMEYATRAEAATSRYYGETEELLGHYAWYAKNSEELVRRVGLKKPNDFGLFDVQGNCFTWCQEAYDSYPQAGGSAAVEDKEGGALVDSTKSRVLRGGSFVNRASNMRSACRLNSYVPEGRSVYFGFRVARTLPPIPLTSLPPSRKVRENF